MVRVEQTIWMRQAGKFKLQGEILELTIFMRREKERLNRLLKTKTSIKT
jgi:hypothetical protein